MTATLAITMAGFGSRFANAGYTAPKYRIEALGRPLFDWSMLALEGFRQAGWTFDFAVRAQENAEDFIRARCRALNIPLGRLLSLPAPTDGQATTALLLAEHAPADAPFAVFNIDTFVRPGAMTPAAIPPCDGWIPCFPGAGEGWSFVRLDDTGVAVELREKKRISDHATVGFYWFSSAKLYRDAYRRFFDGGGEEKGERYIAPMYNQLIADGCKLRILELALDEVGQLGTPAQVEDFIRNPPASARAVAARAS
ncbi:dTDP-glucose pyrophosphorylase [Rhodoblastus sphagnicola]|uniref:dTDP-glucose pyrophosphorylase n=1 Tax=Rhodoblastus sphagnicola TaxID=333368 RepID=A0A2S6MX29_9HYPH|nr:glycosyltransferase family 2 protein [Rhodoblastus sphagnicola]MBB4199236.1 choline kinase [Rhodoblastus sphagnicola]PPQ26908.1 dTDP-glucose pyrophosphorylase [Rhodoblastus sphagnicola]